MHALNTDSSDRLARARAMGTEAILEAALACGARMDGNGSGGDGGSGGQNGQGGNGQNGQNSGGQGGQNGGGSGQGQQNAQFNDGGQNNGQNSGSGGQNGGSGSGGQGGQGGQGGGNGDGSGGQGGGSRSFDDALAGMSDADRAAVLGRLGKVNNEAQGLRAQVRDLKPKADAHDQATAANATDLEKANARAERAEQTARNATAGAVRAYVTAAAAPTFADPSDAAALLGDLSGYANQDGTVDTDRIGTDVAALLESKPHLRKPGTGQGQNGQQQNGQGDQNGQQQNSQNGQQGGQQQNGQNGQNGARNPAPNGAQGGGPAQNKPGERGRSEALKRFGDPNAQQGQNGQRTTTRQHV